VLCYIQAAEAAALVGVCKALNRTPWPPVLVCFACLDQHMFIDYSGLPAKEKAVSGLL
jgi:hypothetical protein